MIQSYINTITPLTSNTDSVVFQKDCIRTGSCDCNNCRSWLCHNEGSANYNIVYGGRYEVDFNASVSSATSGVIAFALFNNGEEIPGTRMVETLAAAGDYANISVHKVVPICCNGNGNISVRSIANVPTPTDPTTPIATQTPIIASTNITIRRNC